MSDRNQHHAVVTGGSKGIGMAVVERLLDDDHRVTAVARDRTALDALVDHLGDRFGDALAVRSCDVTDEAAVVELFETLAPVDILVNNAGISHSAPISRITLEDWNRHLAVNATGAFLCMRAVVDPMRERGWGRIVTVASVTGHEGAPYIAAYAASKHAVLGLTRSVAAELQGSGVTANVVSPSYVDTPMTRQTLARIEDRTGRNQAEALEALLSVTRLNRLIPPEEVAGAVAFLIASPSVNGQSVIIDGAA
ncbi:MAG TPA: SDR family oxidoreductase [Acidimicrobiales bacterium]|nr:SDR family oxidoreductase [Acidimicrobiales bacterium]